MTDEYISLIPTRDAASNSIQWTMVHDGKVGQGGDYPDVDLPAGSGNTKITFTIVDPNNLGIKFDPRLIDNSSNPKAINAIWIEEGSGTSKTAGAYPSQIDRVQLQGNAGKLVVGDKNTQDVVLTYQLNFVNPANPTESITSIDPEIRNGGTGQFEFLSMETVAVVLGLAVLALAALQWVTYRRSSKANAQSKPPQAGPSA